MLATQAKTINYTIDPVHSKVEFQVKHLGIATFQGEFTVYQGSLSSTDGQLNAVSGQVDIASIRVPEQQLTNHLLSEDFFAVEQYPYGEFSADNIEQDGDKLTITGDLTLRGTSKPVQLTGTVSTGQGMDGTQMLAVQAEGEINRNDYGISWDSTLDSGAAVVAEKVKIVLNIEAREDA